jgi:hypothetical protein
VRSWQARKRSAQFERFRRLFEKYGPRTVAKKAGEELEDAIARVYKDGFDCMIPDASGAKHPLRVIPMR